MGKAINRKERKEREVTAEEELEKCLCGPLASFAISAVKKIKSRARREREGNVEI